MDKEKTEISRQEGTITTYGRNDDDRRQYT